MSGMYIVLLRQTLSILYQVISSAIQRFFSKLNSYYALVIKICGCRLLLITFNPISIERNDRILASNMRCNVCILKLITYKKDSFFVICTKDTKEFSILY